MANLNSDILKKNIRDLLAKNGVRQEKLADILGMSQGNVSKALNSKEKKCFTVEQIFLISQHFGVSLDELTGNTVAQHDVVRPEAVLDYLVLLLKNRYIKAETVEVEEYVYEQYTNSHGYPDCKRKTVPIKYPAFYFPSYLSASELSETEEEYDEMDLQFCFDGNESAYKSLNEILAKFLPIIDLYLKKEIPEDALQMIVDGYLEQLIGQ